MKIADIRKLSLYIPRIIDAQDGWNYNKNDINDVHTIFISDTIPMTSLMSEYLNKFRLSTRFTRNIYFEKYVRTGKVNYVRSLGKLRNSLLRSRAILETNPNKANSYDMSLENMAFRKSFGELMALKRIQAKFEMNIFTNSKPNTDVYWILTDNTIDGRPEAEEIDLNKSTIMLSRLHKEHPLNPETNKNIENIFVVVPVDTEKDNNSVNLQFLTVKIYEKGKQINYPRMLAIMEKLLLTARKMMGKKLFTMFLPKKSADEVIYIDDSYGLEQEGITNEKNKEINQTHYTDQKIDTKATKNKVSINGKEAVAINNNVDVEHIKVLTKDKSQISNTTMDQLKQTYLKESYNDEIKSMFEASVRNFTDTIELKKHKIENADDGVSIQDRHIFTLIDKDSGKEKEFKLLIPRVVDKKFFKIYDKKYILANQVYSNLVNKIKEDTVSLTTSHTKTMIYIQGKLDERIGKYLSKQKNRYVNYTKYDSTLTKLIPNSLHSIFKYTPIFQFKEYIISYDVYNADYSIPDDETDLLYKRVIGIKKEFYPEKEIVSNANRLHNYIKQLYMDKGQDSILFYNTHKDTLNDKQFLLELKNEYAKTEENIKKMPIPGSNQFARMNIAGKKIPVLIAMLIAYQNSNPGGSLKEFFKKYFPSVVSIVITDAEIKMDNTIDLKLSDGYMNINLADNLIGNELLFSILRKINLSKYTKDNFNNNNDIQLILTAFFEKEKYQPDTAITSLSIALKTLLDPITVSLIENTNYEYILDNKRQKPYDLVTILYYCITLLNDRSYKPGNDFNAYRIRNMESIPAIIYKLVGDKVADASKKINNRNNNRRKLIDAISVLEGEVLEEVRNLTTFETFSDINIANEIGLISKATYKGFAGLNNNRAVSYDLRATDPSSIGFIDIGNNVDNMNVGSNRMMSYNPNIKDIRGINKIDPNLKEKVINNERLTDEETASFLSFDTYTEPFLAAHADAPRISMASIQARHVIPLDTYDRLPVRSGLEESIKDVVSSAYVIKSPTTKDKYKVTKIDEKNKEIVLDNSIKVSYKDKVMNNSGGGFSWLATYEPCVKVGQTIEKDRAVALEQGSFKKGSYTNAKLLRCAILNFGETLEDGAILSKSAADNLQFKYVSEKSILIRKDQTIIKMIQNIGEDVTVGQPLVVFSKDDEEDGLDSIFGNINKDLTDLDLHTYIKSKYSGKIVDIKIQYNGELRKIKPLQGLINKLPKENIIQLKTDRMAGEIAPQGILITYYILTKLPGLTGSKCTVQSTKSVFRVHQDDDMPMTMDGKRIDYVFSAFSIVSRMTNNNFLSLYLNKCIMELREQLKKNLK